MSSLIREEDVNCHIICHICKGYIIDATTIIECLHSFCKSCIVRYLAKDGRCPKCEIPAHKARPLLNLRSDKILQALVYKLKPQLYHEEMLQRKIFQVQNELPIEDVTLSRCDETPIFLQPAEPKKIQVSLEYDTREIKLPDKSRWEKTSSKFPKRYLRCSDAMSIETLHKFIRTKCQSNSIEIVMFCNSEMVSPEESLYGIKISLRIKKKQNTLSLTYMTFRDKTPDQPLLCGVAMTIKNKMADKKKNYEVIKKNLIFQQNQIDVSHNTDVIIENNKPKEKTPRVQEVGGQNFGMFEEIYKKPTVSVQPNVHTTAVAKPVETFVSVSSKPPYFGLNVALNKNSVTPTSMITTTTTLNNSGSNRDVKYFGLNVPLHEAVPNVTDLKSKSTNGFSPATTSATTPSKSNTVSSNTQISQVLTVVRPSPKPFNIKPKGKSINSIANRLQQLQQQTQLVGKPISPKLSQSQIIASPLSSQNVTSANSPSLHSPTMLEKLTHDQAHSLALESAKQIGFRKSPTKQSINSVRRSINDNYTQKPHINLSYTNKSHPSPIPHPTPPPIKTPPARFTVQDRQLFTQAQQLAELRKQQQMLDDIAAAVAAKNKRENQINLKKKQRGRPHGQQNHNFTKNNNINHSVSNSATPSVFGHYRIANNFKAADPLNVGNTMIKNDPKDIQKKKYNFTISSHSNNAMSTNGAVWRAMSSTESIKPTHVDYFGKKRPPPPPNVTMTSYSDGMLQPRPKLDIYESTIQKARDAVRKMDKEQTLPRTVHRVHPYAPKEIKTPPPPFSSQTHKPYTSSLSTRPSIAHATPYNSGSPRLLSPGNCKPRPQGSFSLQRPQVNTRWSSPNLSSPNAQTTMRIQAPPYNSPAPVEQQLPNNGSFTNQPEQDQPLCLVVRK